MGIKAALCPVLVGAGDFMEFYEREAKIDPAVLKLRLCFKR